MFLFYSPIDTWDCYYFENASTKVFWHSCSPNFLNRKKWLSLVSLFLHLYRILLGRYCQENVKSEVFRKKDIKGSWPYMALKRTYLLTITVKFFQSTSTSMAIYYWFVFSAILQRKTISATYLSSKFQEECSIKR